MMQLAHDLGKTAALCVVALSITALMLGAVGLAQAQGQIMLVTEGTAHAVIVVPEQPLPIAQYAAEELASHIEQATGVRLPIVEEKAIPAEYASRIFVGMTQAAAEIGIVASALPPEAFVLRTVGPDLFIVGEDELGHPLRSQNSQCGTLFGVYELLERYVGVRWAWPGELGTYVPGLEQITVAPVDETIAPTLAYREIAWSKIQQTVINKNTPYHPREEQLGFTAEGLESYGQDLYVYLRRHRMGGRDRHPPTGHAFSSWWERHGQEHPEWFMMHEHGTRGVAEGLPPGLVAMCVSNPDLHRYIVDSWDGESAIRLGEIDRMVACVCPECRAWDGPVPVIEGLEGFWWFPMSNSDRYARFWAEVQRLAAERNPDALITTYLYQNYFPAPASGIRLNEHIFGEFVQWGNPRYFDFFPMREDVFEWLKQQWLGWKETGIRISYRPNYLWDGYVMPQVTLRQPAEFFKFAIENGMEGSRFDSLNGQWATQGPKLYLHMRLHAKPELAIEEVLDEYYEVFGPASEQVREYFDYWEQYFLDNMQYINDMYVDAGLHRWRRFNLLAHRAFPPASFEPAERILADALLAAQTVPDHQYRRRVRFLQLGLEHANIAGRLAACFDGERGLPAGSERYETALETLRELIAFRKEHEGLYISDYYTQATGQEIGMWDLRGMLAELDPE